MVSTVVQHFRSQFALPGAAAVGRPCKSRVADLAGLGEDRQLRQHPRQHRFIAPAVMGRAEGAAHGVIDKDRPWRDDLADNIEGRARQQCRNAAIIDHMGDETDGLVAEGSIRHQQCKINFRFYQVLRDGGHQARCEGATSTRGGLGAPLAALMGRYSKGMITQLVPTYYRRWPCGVKWRPIDV